MTDDELPDLAPDARAILDAGATDDPTDADRRRNWSGLRRKLGPVLAGAAVTAATSAGAGTAGAAATTGILGAKFAVAVAAIAIAAGGSGYAWWRGHRGATRAAPVASTSAAATPSAHGAPSVARSFETAAPSEIASAPEVVSVETPTEVPPPKEPKPSAAPVTSVGDDLELEIVLLRDAQAALASGDAARALVALDRHAAAHPRGQLAEERAGLRAIALCTLGRADGRSAAAMFLDRHARSPLAIRVRAACGS
jgi:hypothetical protein